MELYAAPAFQAVAGKTLRPGGFALTQAAISCSGLSPGATILDLGCGRGATVRYLRKRWRMRAVGVDPCRERFEPDLPLAQARAERLPFSDGRFDGVICECVLSLTPDPEKTLTELARVLVSGGVLMVSDLYQPTEKTAPSPGSARHTPAAAACFSRCMSRSQLFKITEKAGLGIAHWADHSRLLAELAGQLVFAYGSLKGFWEKVGLDGEAVKSLGESCKPGYYLMIAKKVQAQLLPL